MGHSVGTTLPLLCWEEARRDSVPGEHQSSTRHEEGKEKQVQGLEVGGGLGDGSEEGQDSQEERRLGLGRGRPWRRRFLSVLKALLSVIAEGSGGAPP